jgi:uncharacterized repeat protein (TIGR01451 family)
VIKKIAILLGVNTVDGYQPPAYSVNARYAMHDTLCTVFKRILPAVLLAACILNMTFVFNKAYAGFGIVNTAGLSFSNCRNDIHQTVYDTAAIDVMDGAVLTIAKDVHNVRTGDTSTDVVVAFRGDTIEFIMHIENKGSDYAKNATIIDSIPFGTTYDTGSAMDTVCLDPIDPPDTITFQHAAGEAFDEIGTGTITAIKWQWDRIDGVSGYNRRVAKFRVRVQ